MALVRPSTKRPRPSPSSSEEEGEGSGSGSLMAVGALVPSTAATARASKAAGREMGYRQGMPTPSPLRRMEDPVREHVLPRKRGGGGSSRKELMPPPAPRPPKGRRKGRQPSEALDEETFVEAMGEIIERDFFPELPKLQRQMKWLESLERRRLRSLTDVRRAVQSEMRRDSLSSSSSSASVAAAAAGGGAETPLMQGRAFPPASPSPSFSSSAAASVASAGNGNGAGAAAGGALPLSLDQFLAWFQSEDDAAFDVLAEKMRAAHRRKYWWVYEPPAHLAIEAGREKLYLLPSGEFMSGEARARHVAASDAKPRLGDGRPNGPETWPYRPKNALMFPPELEETAKVYSSKPDGAAALGREGPVLLLTADGEPIQPSGNGKDGAMVVAPDNARVGQAAKAPKAVVHSNTRFTADFKKHAGFMPSPLERLASDVSSVFSADSASLAGSEAERAAAKDTFVPMTPLLIPGAAGDLPIMTWGEVEATPLRVAEPFDAAEAAAAASASRRDTGFHIKGPSQREQVASALGSRGSRDGKKQQQAQHGRGPGQGKHRDVRSLTPAAQSLAAKLAGALSSSGQHAGAGAGGAFGGGATSQLRASYGGPSSSSVRTGSSVARTGAAAVASSVPTPSPSPMRIGTRAGAAVSRPAGAGAEGGGGGGWGGRKGTSKVTENLLNI